MASEYLAVPRALLEDVARYLSDHGHDEQGQVIELKIDTLITADNRGELAPVIRQKVMTRPIHQRAQHVAQALGYLQWAYTSGSALWGYSLMSNAPDSLTSRRPATLIDTEEFGLLLVLDESDMGLAGIAGWPRRKDGE